MVYTNLSILVFNTVCKDLYTYHGIHKSMYHDALSDRQFCGLQLVSVQSKIKRKNKLHYPVLSQSEKGQWYDVIKRMYNEDGLRKGEWTCNCLDFIYRHVTCKHLYAVTLWKQ